MNQSRVYFTWNKVERVSQFQTLSKLLLLSYKLRYVINGEQFK